MAATQQGATTFYVGQHVEWSQGTLTRTIYANGQRIAMRRGSTLSFLLADTLGSTTLTLSASGAPVAELRYDPWGALRYQSGSTPTALRFTGQRLDKGTGLYFYQSRYYDPALGRFLQPDTIVPDPGDPQSFNRFAYVLNNPLRYTDPTGHFSEEEIATFYGVNDVTEIWWWDDPDYAEWQNIVRHAQYGDILVAEVNGHIYNVMFTDNSPSFVLWDVDNQRPVNPSLFGSPTWWQLFRSESRNYQNYVLSSTKFGSLPGLKGQGLREPKLKPGWEGSVTQRGLRGSYVHPCYEYPSLDGSDGALIVVGITAGALGGSVIATPGVGSVVGAVVGGTGALLTSIIETSFNAPPRPKYYGPDPFNLTGAHPTY